MIPIDSIRERLSRLDSSLRVLREIASVGRNRIAGDRDPRAGREVGPHLGPLTADLARPPRQPTVGLAGHGVL
ncbi:MAG: hypothetical protein ACP6IT_09495, partial [Candidatus Thorarchaeota archaeon]